MPANAKCVSFSSLSQISLCRLRVQFKSKQLHCERYLPAEFPSRLVHLLVQFMYGYRIIKTHHTCIGTHTSSKSPRVHATSSTYSNSPIAYHIDSTISLLAAAPNRKSARAKLVLACVRVACVCEIIYSYSNFFLARLFFDTIFSRVAHIFACAGMCSQLTYALSDAFKLGTFPVAGNSCLFFHCTLLIFCM